MATLLCSISTFLEQIIVKINKLVTSLVLAGLVVSAPLAYAESNASGMTDTQKKQVQDVVHDYIIKNPDVVVQSLQIYQQSQMDQAKKTIENTQNNSPKYADALFHQASDPVAGNPNGKFTVVEFFDYQCPHCVDMSSVIDDLVKNNPNVRVVFKEFPIRGPISEIATKAALAAQQQGKYYEFHKALMTSKQEPLTEDAIYALAKSVGLDVDKLKTAMRSDAVAQQIKANYKLAQDLQLLGTPALFIAKTNISKGSPSTAIVFVPGQVDKAQMQAMLAKVSS